MPVKRPGVHTGVSSSLIKKAAEANKMSQPLDLDAQLAELEGFAGLEELAAEAQEQAGAEAPAADPNAPKEDAVMEEAAAAAEPEAAAPVEEAAAEPLVEEPGEEELAEEAAAAPSGGEKKKPAFKPLAPKKPAIAAKKASPAKAAPPKPKAKLVVARAAPAEPVDDEDPAKEEPAKEEEPTPEGSKPAASKKPASKPKPVAKKAAGDKEADGEGAKGKGKKASAAKEKGGPKKAKSAYNLFCEANRAQVKADNPDISFGEIGKVLGANWKALSAEDKAGFEALAEADKQRFAAEKELNDAEQAAVGSGEEGEAAGSDGSGAGPSKPTKGAKAAAPRPRKPAGGKAPSAFQLFCADQRPAVQAAHPKAGEVELAKLLAAAWKDLAEEDRAVFEAQHHELKKSGAGREPKAAGKKKVAGVKRAAQETHEEEAEPASKEVDGEDDEDEQRRMNADWEAAPAEFILAESKDGRYMVLREGKLLADYGMCSAKEAKRQRLGGGAGASPVSLEMVEEFEAFNRAFQRAVHDNSVDGDLDLEHIPGGSPLEACLILGKMREQGFELAAKGKNDVLMKVPLLATSKAVQRLVDCERKRADAWKARAESAEALLAAGGKAAAAEGPSPRTQQRKGAEV